LPLCSPDLNPIYFLLWGSVKEGVYDAEVQEHSSLISHILVAVRNMRAQPIPLGLVREPIDIAVRYSVKLEDGT
jgi:hypothetical protein